MFEIYFYIEHIDCFILIVQTGKILNKHFCKLNVFVKSIGFFANQKK
jgi:hypothetical protein